MSTVPKNNKIVISQPTISTTDIARYFDIERKTLNKIFLELKWIKRKYFLWLAITESGKEKGAKKENREILWNRAILGDKELILAIRNSKNIIDETVNLNRYKLQVYNKYKKAGYTIWDYSKEKGTYDKNIHFVAKRDKEVLLIHCKSDEKDISQEEIVTFIENKSKFIIENPVFGMYTLKIKYIMSHFSLTEEAFKYLNKNKNTIFYEIFK
ncbi:hypothetical protein MNB_SV-13-1322 [hydrothermal vent metagenome]|uniref:Uncharacterized protein n=1 Tax=hydrothermal vent metagenome TaxID=652676 RepID=A0A1W1CXE9_9ZZZZ